MPKIKRYNFEFFQGDDYTFSITVKNADASVVDLTGYTAKMQARENYDSESTVLDLSVDNGIVVIPATGVIVVSISNTLTSAIDGGYYLYDLETSDANGLKSKIIFGKFEVLKEITKS